MRKPIAALALFAGGLVVLLAALGRLPSSERPGGPLSSGPVPIRIDGRFDDWAAIKSYTDPAGDTHDTDHKQRDDRPAHVEHPDVDLLEYKVAHDGEHLYFYFRSRGVIGRTQRAAPGREAGRYYVVVTIDVDRNDETGYWIHEGGYYPTSPGRCRCGAFSRTSGASRSSARGACWTCRCRWKPAANWRPAAPGPRTRVSRSTATSLRPSALSGVL